MDAALKVESYYVQMDKKDLLQQLCFYQPASLYSDEPDWLLADSGVTNELASVARFSQCVPGSEQRQRPAGADYGQPVQRVGEPNIQPSVA